MLSKIKQIYEQHYKLLMLIPTILIILSILQIGYQTYSTGDFIHRGASLKGGSTITLNKALPVTSIQGFLSTEFPGAEFQVREISNLGKVTEIAIDSEFQEKAQVDTLKQKIEQQFSLTSEDINSETYGSALGSSFFRQAALALLISFLFMAIVVLLYFRVWVPSLAVILAAFSDILVTMAIFNLTGMRLGTGGVAAFLMLIGYSIDTDILLTSRVLKRSEGTVMDRIYSSIKTGMTMTITTIAVVSIALIFIQSEVIRQIMLIIFIGMFVDMVMTWIQNVGILRLYLKQ